MKKVIVVVGPTAIGKTKISIELAKRLDADIISGDSVAVYKRLDIGSAKPTKEEMNGVLHYLIDEYEPQVQYDVATFQKRARNIIDNTDKNIIICGGTGLYIQSVIYDYNFLASKRDSEFEEQFKNYSNDELYDYLVSLDSSINQEKIHKNNRKRVLRAIEIIKETNKINEPQEFKKNKIYDFYIVYLNVGDRKVLYDRINKRVDLMFEEGLYDEVYNLYKDGITPHAIGYKELVPVFEGVCSLDSAIEDIKKNSRHLAKRQITWFKNQLDTHLYEVNLDNIDSTIDEIYNDLVVFLEDLK